MIDVLIRRFSLSRSSATAGIDSEAQRTEVMDSFSQHEQTVRKREEAKERETEREKGKKNGFKGQGQPVGEVMAVTASRHRQCWRTFPAEYSLAVLSGNGVIRPTWRSLVCVGGRGGVEK